MSVSVGEHSKAFLESVTASCGSHWWAQLGWESCADVVSESQSHSLPEAPLVLKYIVRITGWEASWRARAGNCGCLLLGTQRANRLRELKVMCSAAEVDEQDIVRHVFPAGIQATHPESDSQEKTAHGGALEQDVHLPLPSPVMMGCQWAQGEMPPGSWSVTRTLASEFPFWDSFFEQK